RTATLYDLYLGTSNPPSAIATGLTSASYAPAALIGGATYFWQVVAHDSFGTIAGPIWSFTTISSTAASPDIVVYASDIPSTAVHGAWAAAVDTSAANGVKLATPDNGWSATDAPLVSPTDYVDVPFIPPAGAPYTLWIRAQALNNSKYNDSLWMQFSDAVVNGSSVYPLNSAS